MFSFAKKCLVCGLVYTLGYFQVNFYMIYEKVIYYIPFNVLDKCWVVSGSSGAFSG
jgi:hypothetical protein